MTMEHLFDMALLPKSHGGDGGGGVLKDSRDAENFAPPTNVRPFLRKLVVQDDVQTRYSKLFEQKKGMHNIKPWLFRKLLWRTYASAPEADTDNTS